MDNNSEIVIYQSQDGQAKLDVRLEGETVWLTQDQMAELFDRDRTAINRHINNIFAEGELDKNVVCANFAHTTSHGAMEGKTQTRLVPYYNLDVVISVGYRVKSQRGVQFRQWATKRIHEYIVKGFTLDDERLKGNGGGTYWKELDAMRSLVSGFFDFAEMQAKLHQHMYMADYMSLLEDLIRVNKRPVLSGKGQVSAEQAKSHALGELKKFKERRLSPAEEDYMDTIKALNQEAKAHLKK